MQPVPNPKDHQPESRRSCRCMTSCPASKIITSTATPVQSGETSEKSRQHKADKGELHCHADGGNQQAAVNFQSEYYGKTCIDQNKDTCQDKVPITQGNVAGHWPTSSRTRPASTASCRRVMRLA
jgi:hypothetical protein